VDARSDKGAPTKNTRTLKLTTRGDREIVMTREFDAPRRLVFDALTKPELVKQWLLGPPGWSMPVCEIDLRVGGTYRYVWRHTDGKEMGMGGVYREIVPQERVVCSELFDEPWYPGEALVTTTLAEGGQDHADVHDPLHIARGPRRRAEVRHGARGCSELRPACGVVGTAGSCWDGKRSEPVVSETHFRRQIGRRIPASRNRASRY